MNSDKYNLNKNDLLKVGRIIVVSLIGSAITLVLQYGAQIDFGQWQPVANIAFIALTEASRRFLKDSN